MTHHHKKQTRGKNADRPSEIPKEGWLDIAKRTLKELKSDHVQIVAAGVAFYFFLSLFPTIAAAVSLYGLFVDPAQVTAHIDQLSGLLPAEARQSIGEIGSHVASQSGQALGWGVALSVLVSLWSANKGTKALFEGINIAYNETDERGFFKLAARTLLFTVVALVTGACLAILVVGFPAFVSALGLPAAVELTLNIARWPVAALLVALLVAYAYRLAPDRDDPKWRWVSWGSAIATALWLIGSALFSLYVSNFGAFGSTYGSFAAVIILMLWFLLTAFVILLGAEINSEMEHQTAKDTTKGPSQPMGLREAYYADHVASGSDGRG